jgi:hypothetical protein
MEERIRVTHPAHHPRDRRPVRLSARRRTESNRERARRRNEGGMVPLPDQMPEPFARAVLAFLETLT